MSHDGSLSRSASPTVSEVVLRHGARADDEAYKKDKHYRRYASNVDRALSLFDSTLQEWADYISFLSRLLKALQAHPASLPIVPNKVLVAKRLAQCLNPSLPSGVHQKALEVYGFVFGMLKERLSFDLFLYLPGIAPTLTFASLSVRTLFLAMVDTYIIRLDPSALRPALKSIILALVPGLEDETSDDFETTLLIVHKLQKITYGTNDAKTDYGTPYFWQCLFLASITNPSRRLGILAYLNRYLPKLGGPDPWASEPADDIDVVEVNYLIDSVTKPDPGLLVRCFSTGLNDEQVLVQRNFLDLLVTHIPLHSPLLQRRISSHDFRILVAAATSVVIRRDMSLNRRLWSWFLGPESPGGAGDRGNITSAAGSATDFGQSQYFEKFGLKPLVQSLQNMIWRNSMNPPERAKPFRICLSLMDRWEVGSHIVPRVFLPTMRSVQQYDRSAPTRAQFDEVFRSASSFFDGVESSLIFSEIIGLIRIDKSEVKPKSQSALDDLRLASFIVANFKTREEEMLLVHIPLLLLVTIAKMRTMAVSEETEPELVGLQQAALRETTSLANALLDQLLPRALKKNTRPGATECIKAPSNETITNKILEFYKISRQRLELPAVPFAGSEIANMLLQGAKDLVLCTLNMGTRASFLKSWTNFFTVMLTKAPECHSLREGGFFESLYASLFSISKSSKSLSFVIISSITLMITTLYSIHTPGSYINYKKLCAIIPFLVQRLWGFMSPLRPKFHVEAVRCLWLLHSVTWQDHFVEADITSLMIKSDRAGLSHCTTADQAERFFILWNHSLQSNNDFFASRLISDRPRKDGDLKDSRFTYQQALLERPLYLVLDLLSDPDSEASFAVREWLKDPPFLHRIFRMLLLPLDELSLDTYETISSRHESEEQVELETASQYRYFFETLLNVLDSLNPSGGATVVSHSVSGLPVRPGSYEGSLEERSIQVSIAHLAVRALRHTVSVSVKPTYQLERLQRAILAALESLLTGPGAENLVHSNLDILLIEILSSVVDAQRCSLQPVLIDTLLYALKNRIAHEAFMPKPETPTNRRSSIETLSSLTRLSASGEKARKEEAAERKPKIPPQLLPCLLKGIGSKSSHNVMQKWVTLLAECLPFYYENIFQTLLRLVESLCTQITAAYFDLQHVFQKQDQVPEDRSEHVIISLLTGLENCLASAHQSLLAEEASVAAPPAPEQSQSFLGSISGLLSSEGTPTVPSKTANNKLSVLLCFQDAVRLCFSIWSWGLATDSEGSNLDVESVGSFQYTSLRMRNRSRRILEHVFDAQVLDCLETVIEIWRKAVVSNDVSRSRLVFNLLHTLDGSRPSIAIPAVFNSIYSRTNPGALDPSRKSSLTLTLAESDLAAFLVTYARSLDDDALDEIWGNCTTFLQDVLANPFPHRHILPRLMEFAAILGDKMQHTHFGDDKRARKELGDLLFKLLAAIFSTKPLGSSQEPSSSIADRPGSSSGVPGQMVGSDDIVSILATCVPAVAETLEETDKTGTAMMHISSNIISPIFHSRLFPQNINKSALDLVAQVAKIPAAAKYWNKDVGDAFNDSRFFSTKLTYVRSHWLELLRHWIVTEKDRLPELLGRISPPATAGIMFGVGATAARLDADHKAQLNLRRIVLLILAANDDHFSSELTVLYQKLEELLTATAVSSPSSATRAEIFMVLRAMVLKTSAIHLAPFWPLINSELHEAISAIIPDKQSDTYNAYSLLQACKLLETLLIAAPDDFQLQEWLFVASTIDVIYPPDRWQSPALSDRVADALGPLPAGEDYGRRSLDRSSFDGYAGEATTATAAARRASVGFGVGGARNAADGTDDGDGGDGAGRRAWRAWLNSERSRETARDEIVDVLLRPFLSRLSIWAFEGMYSLVGGDVAGCGEDLLRDVFNDFTMVRLS